MPRRGHDRCGSNSMPREDRRSEARIVPRGQRTALTQDCVCRNALQRQLSRHDIGLDDAAPTPPSTGNDEGILVSDAAIERGRRLNSAGKRAGTQTTNLGPNPFGVGTQTTNLGPHGAPKYHDRWSAFQMQEIPFLTPTM
jgi:hypothetical protein